MKKKIFALMLCALPLSMAAQETFDALQMSQTELRGTSRFMSMAGAFGALGGDISSMTQNPAGIGVYRNSDLGVTFSLDFNGAKSPTDKLNKTRFNVNTFGYVGVIRLPGAMRSLNWGVSYNRLNSYNRRYTGYVGDIGSSITNYVADYCNRSGAHIDDTYFDDAAPRIGYVSVGLLGNNGYRDILHAEGNKMAGMFNSKTYGTAEYLVNQRGYTDEFNLTFAGNILDKVYWGVDLGIINLDYTTESYFIEAMNESTIQTDFETQATASENTYSKVDYENHLHTDGTGINAKIGVIVKPINELRIGAAVHTPTYYKMRDLYSIYTYAEMYENPGSDVALSSDFTGSAYYESDQVDYTIRTPWRFIGSVAGVIGTKGLLSLDYEYIGNQSIRVGDDGGHVYTDTRESIKDYLKPSHVIRIGGEYRINPSWSVRAGYSYKSGQVKDAVSDGTEYIYTTGDNVSYEYEKNTQYITAGLGYKHKAFYADLAYVHKNRTTVYNAYGPTAEAAGLNAEIKDQNNRVSLTLGVRF